MWDLDTIIRQNNEAALDYMMRGKQLEEAQSPQPEAWVLSLLASKLTVGPPLLTHIIDCLENIDTVEGFLGLIRTLLPEYELEIMSEPRNRRVYRFCYHFGKKYYPLPANTECGVGDWVSSMPVALMAMSYSAYHELEMRPGYLLLLSLVIYPYEGDKRDEEDDRVPFGPESLPTEKYRPSARDISWVRDLVATLAVGGQWIAPMGFVVVKVAENRVVLREAIDTPEVKETIRRTLLIANKAGIEAAFDTTGRTSEEKLNGAKVPLFDVVQRMVGTELAERIPVAGWYPDELHQMTNKTPYDGLGDFADWACSQTGCVVLDSSYDDCYYVEGYGEPIFKWTKYNVDTLTKQWPKVQEIRGKIDHLVEWLEADQINKFTELLDFLLKSKSKNTEPKTKRLYDPTERVCELDQLYGDEGDDDD
ncbi:hypothetical protein ES708_29988 [subsurface metagenome]